MLNERHEGLMRFRFNENDGLGFYGITTTHCIRVRAYEHCEGGGFEGPKLHLLLLFFWIRCSPGDSGSFITCMAEAFHNDVNDIDFFERNGLIVT